MIVEALGQVVGEAVAWLVPDWLAAWWRPWVWVPVGVLPIVGGFFFWPEKVPAILAWVVGGLAVFYGIMAEVKQLET